MKRILLLTFLMCGLSVHADMPYINNTISETYERVTTGDLACESRKAHPTLNAGYYQGNDSYYGTFNQREDKGAYVAISIPLTSNSNRVDCKSLYNSALRQSELRVKQLEMQLEMQKSRRLVAE